MKLFTKTFGCQMNFADSDEMTLHFKRHGFSQTPEQENADAVLLNTCTVRDLAEHKAISYVGRLRKWKDSKPDGLVIVTGCAAEQNKASLQKRFPYVDLVVGAKDIENFGTHLQSLLANRHLDEKSLGPKEGNGAGDPLQSVTIMRGCNYNCSYCIVPAVRGRESYRPAQEILDEVRSRVQNGAKEIFLLGQTVNSYRTTMDPGLRRDDEKGVIPECRNPGSSVFQQYDFSNLLRDVNEIEGLKRIRFMSPHPFYVSDNMVQAMADCEKVCRHLHLPVQSGSTPVLKRMMRNYTRESFSEAVQKLREKIPGIALTTDFIVGFPGETEEDFQKTLSLAEEIQFEGAYCFKYSPRPGTKAAEYDDDVPFETKEKRLESLLNSVEEQGRAKAKALIGSTTEVLIEECLEGGIFRGKTPEAWRVRFKNDEVKIGQMVRATISGSHQRELHGKLISA